MIYGKIVNYKIVNQYGFSIKGKLNFKNRTCKIFICLFVISNAVTSQNMFECEQKKGVSLDIFIVDVQSMLPAIYICTLVLISRCTLFSISGKTIRLWSYHLNVQGVFHKKSVVFYIFIIAYFLKPYGFWNRHTKS